MVSWDSIERRRFIRVKLRCPAAVSYEHKKILSAFAEDISVKGIKISLKEELSLASVVDLEIYLRQTPVMCKGRVLWVKKIEDPHLDGGVAYDTGLRFLRLNQDDKIVIKQIIVQQKQSRQR